MPDLTMKVTRTSVQFVLEDDEAETTVTVSPEDDKETQLRKLRRVINLADPGWMGQVLAVSRGEASPNDFRSAPPAPPQPTNGWGDLLKQQEIPEHAKGDYEIIQESE